MKKQYIKIKLREGIDNFINVKEDNKSFEHNSDGTNRTNTHNKPAKEEPTGKKEYADVRRAFQKLGGPSMVDVMKLTGIEDDEKGVNRSLFRKKVKQIKNSDTGSIYQFDDKELASVRAALDIEK